MREPRAWSLLTIDGPRQYGGNGGYVDDPSKVYRYDSDVANYRQVAAGDFVVLKTKTEILGIARIHEIVEGHGPKERLRCPACHATNIKRRLTKDPRYRCIPHGHTFDEPEREVVDVKTLEAHYADTFRKAPTPLTVARVNEAVLRPSDQMSIKEIDLANIEQWLNTDKDCRELVLHFANAMEPESGWDLIDPPQPLGSIIDTRRRVLREITLRRGQRQFRDRLIELYGASCQVSRCAFPNLIEAAHIRPYATSSDNSPGNGLLLRSDLHTIFDLGLLGINPDNLALRLHPAVVQAGYAAFDGTRLFTSGNPGPDQGALRDRWDFFLSRLARVDLQ